MTIRSFLLIAILTATVGGIAVAQVPSLEITQGVVITGPNTVAAGGTLCLTATGWTSPVQLTANLPGHAKVTATAAGGTLTIKVKIALGTAPSVGNWVSVNGTRHTFSIT